MLKSLDGEDFENERNFIGIMYNEELSYHSLTNEIDTLKVILNGNIVECFDDIFKCVKGQQHQLMMMPNIVNLLRLLLVNPATSATAERSFSLARRLKTWMRSTWMPSITGNPFVSLPNSRLPNQQNEKYRHRQNC